MFVMKTMMMMTMMYFYCEKEISEVLVQGRVVQEKKAKGGDSLVWTKECSMAQSFSFDWQVTVTAVSTIALEWVECTFLIDTLA